ncbi:hypothetical protein Cme02nite_37910 [Catellatospora methionotrophica]|uniref:Uncharacterized protein n=1 Tax=Catellatospora methionotrophica TaxID=121620 RepID=A0A8J3LH57_9ACTN|nr:hypothetical protein [Catellatospora methionotrophica]GIG15459.1 hypothetical protein Cme02nite_37910 [Catellatospora methionotrophica]
MAKSEKHARDEKHAENVARKHFGKDGNGVGRELVNEKPTPDRTHIRKK